MSEPFIGEIRMFAGNFAPRSWALCEGQLLSISQNDALFSLLGTVYGGDGRTTFGLPDLRGRIPIHVGSGPGLSPKSLGEKSGQENITLTTNQLPSHTHLVKSNNTVGNSKSGDQIAAGNITRAFNNNPGTTPLNSGTIPNSGGTQYHSNLMPSLCVNFIIALFGIYPSRN